MENQNHQKITILGAGAWGTALGKVAVESHSKVTMWSIEQEVVREINEANSNYKYCGNVLLPKRLKATNSLKAALKDAEIIIIAIPAKIVKGVCDEIMDILSNGRKDKKYIFVNVSKGLSPDNGTMCEYLKKVIPQEICTGIVSLIGPSLAAEVLLKYPTKIMAVSEKIDNARQVSKCFNNDYFKAIPGIDIYSNEYASVLKNVYALFSGMVQGAGYEFNTSAFIMVGIVNEIRKIIKIRGGNPDVVYGLCGLGDLMVTATNKKSRNFSSGYAIASFNSVKDFLRRFNDVTVEGLISTKTIYKTFTEEELQKLPILRCSHAILYEKADIKHSIRKLLLSNDFLK